MVERAFEQDFAAVLFDLDGTLLDSIASVERCWIRWCREHGIDPRRLIGLHGTPARRVIEVLLPGLGEAEAEAAFARIEDLEVEDAGEIVPLPGAVEALTVLARAAAPVAIATSGTSRLALTRLAVSAFPSPRVVVTASDVARGKPDPEPWLLAAERLGVPIGECLVVEDAVAGLTAARAAGAAATLGLTTTHPAQEFGGLADVVVADLSAVVFQVGADGRIALVRA